MNTVTLGGAPEEHGALYWAIRHNKKWVTLGVIVLGVLALLFREEWQPYAVLARRFAAPIGVGLLILYGAYALTRKFNWWKRLIAYACALVLVGVGGVTYQYVSLWVRYNALTVEQLTTLPRTDHERIAPLHAVHSLAQGNLGDSKQLTRPSFVRIRDKDKKEDFYWTMGVEPAYPVDKIFGLVDEIVATPGTTAMLDLSARVRRPVRFAVGENLWLSSNDETAAIRSFDPLMFFSYEPTPARFLIDDDGNPVEIISLIRWKGIFFPYPEFGGVLIIREQKSSTLESYVARVLTGEGHWVRPEKVKDFPYLEGQNILPEKVSGYIVESLRFMNGIMAPLPGYHQGDVRVPSLPDDMNPMPYATYFDATSGLPGMLYHYYALEPFLEGKHGLVASVFIPADGTPRVLVYAHEEKGEVLFGVSQVAGTVRSSKRNYNWDTSVPVEHRPFIRPDASGKNTLYWFTTVVTYKDKTKKQFLGASEVVITNPANSAGDPVWVDAKDPASWAKNLPR